jgi:hypothetical protein
LWQEQTEQTPVYKFKKRLLSAREVLFSRNGGTTYIPIALVLFLMFCAASWLLLWSATDPARYQCYALTFWFGGSALGLLPPEQCTFLATVTPQAFHMLPVEYPPLTLLVFSLPLLLPIAYYQFAFALLMSLIAMVIYWLLQSYGPRGSAFMFAIYLLTGSLALAQMRFDILPALCTLLCLIAAERKHWVMAYVCLAIGVLFKLYPILLLPALFIAEQHSAQRLLIPPANLTLRETPKQLWLTLRGLGRWSWRNCLLFLALLVSVTAFFASFNFHDAVISQIVYFQKRPLQIEAVGSTVLWLANVLGIPWQGVRYEFGSVNIVSPLSGTITLLGTGLLLLGALFVIWLQWRGKIDLVQASIAFILLFIATGKVFSPQYLLWLIPLLVYAGAFDMFWLFFWGGISILTNIHYVFLNARLPPSTGLPQIITLPTGYSEVIAVRNLFFVFVTLAYLFNWFQARQRQPAPLVQTAHETQPLLL